MRPPRPRRTAARAALVLAMAVVAPTAAGCGLLPDAAADPAPVTVELTVPAAEAPPGMTGRPFGCGDLLVPVETVPVATADRAATALDFLLDDEQEEHGDPALHNAVAASSDTLTFTGHRRAGDVEVFTFTGAVTADDACAAERIRAQLEQTARDHSSAGDVRLEVDGRDLDEVLGLDPWPPAGDSSSAEG